MAAADLHQLVVAAGLDEREDLPGDGAAELGVAELVDEPHRGRQRRLKRRDRGAGVHEQPSPGGDRLDQRRLDRAARALLVGAQCEARGLVDA